MVGRALATHRRATPVAGRKQTLCAPSDAASERRHPDKCPPEEKERAVIEMATVNASCTRVQPAAGCPAA